MWYSHYMKKNWLILALISLIIVLFLTLFSILQIIVDVRERISSIDDTIHTWDIHISQGDK